MIFILQKKLQITVLQMTKKKKIKRKQLIIIVISIIVLVLAATGVIAHIVSFFSGGSAENRRFDYEKYHVSRPDIFQMFLTKNENSRPGTELKKVNGIVIHYTANPGSTAEGNRNYFESRKDESVEDSSNKVSSHFIVGLDGEIIQCIPLNEVAYASNDRNYDTISIECCHRNKNGKFTEATYDSLLNLCAWLCDKYELSQKDIIRHYDVTGKMCPLYYVRHKDAWIRLKKDIWDRLLSFGVEE